MFIPTTHNTHILPLHTIPPSPHHKEQNHVFSGSTLNVASTPSLSNVTSSMDVMPFLPRTLHSQSLPPTPTAVRSFTDFNGGDHLRMSATTAAAPLQGSNSSLDVSSLGSMFSSQTKMSYTNGIVPTSTTSTSTTNGFKYTPSAFEPTYEYVKVGGTNGYYGNGGGSGLDYGNQHQHQHHGLITTLKPQVIQDYLLDDDLTDVFSGLSLNKDSFLAAPGYGRARPRRSSAPVNDLWSDGYENELGGFGGGSSNLSRAFSSNALSSNGWNGMTSQVATVAPESNSSAVSSIWGSRPDSQLSSYSGGSEQGISPVYSPVSNGTFEHTPVVTTATYTIPPPVSLSADVEGRNSHKVCVCVVCV